jgi:hypothetical protein
MSRPISYETNFIVREQFYCPTKIINFPNFCLVCMIKFVLFVRFGRDKYETDYTARVNRPYIDNNCMYVVHVCMCQCI